MSDFVLLTGDQVLFQPTFGVAVVTVLPGVLSGSGPATLNGVKVCVDGDEANVSVPGCPYVTATHTIPGVGTLKIDRLAGDQKAAHTKTGGKAVLLKGSTFTAKFEVQTPAQQPQPAPAAPVPDATAQYSGSGRFITTNLLLKAT